MQSWAHKDRNSKDITEAEEIKWQEYTEELYKKDLQFSSVAQSCLTLCDPMNRSTPRLPVQLSHPYMTTGKTIALTSLSH